MRMSEEESRLKTASSYLSIKLLEEIMNTGI